MRQLTREDLEAMQLPRHLWTATAGQIPPGEDTAKFLTYLRKMPATVRLPAGAYVHGGAGRGKTGAAAVALKVARSHGCPGLFVNIPQYIAKMKAREEMHAYDLETSFSQALRRVDLLVLDDLTQVDLDGKWFGVDELVRILRTRSDDMKAVILTSRVPFLTFTRSYPQVAGEMSRIYPIGLTGPDLRAVSSVDVAGAFEVKEAR